LLCSLARPQQLLLQPLLPSPLGHWLQLAQGLLQLVLLCWPVLQEMLLA
jgi:hypothetical protein